MIKKDTLLGLLASVAVTAIVAVGAVTPSLAATQTRVHARTYDAQAYDAQASVALRCHAPSVSGAAATSRTAPPTIRRAPPSSRLATTRRWVWCADGQRRQSRIEIAIEGRTRVSAL
jgi:hypothetical protein